MMINSSGYDFAVIFDMDGVIVDSALAHKKAIEKFCRRHEFPFSEDKFRKGIFGKTNRFWLSDVFNITSAEQIKKYSEEKEFIYRNNYGHLVTPVQGIVSFVRSLDEKGIAKAVATSAPRANVEFILNRVGIAQYFNVVLDDASVKNSKPDPEIYTKTAEKLKFLPETCIVIEDSLSGIESAKRAKCKVIALTTTHSIGELSKSGADLIVKDFDGITLQGLKELFEHP
jgi:beta-phosphoglucomutase